jgi:hypothetical protein
MTLTLLLVAAAVVPALWYIAHCAWYPFAACRRCDGDGKFRSASGQAWRKCRRCRGTGERLRLGRRAWNHFAGLRRDTR